MLKIAPYFPASYAEGYAPLAGMSAYPQLWRRLAFALAPGLGPVGSSLRNLVPAAGAGHPIVTTDTEVFWQNWMPRGLWAAGREVDSGNCYFSVNGSASGNVFKPLPVPMSLFWCGRWKSGGPENKAFVLLTATNKLISAGGHKRGYHFFINTTNGKAVVEQHAGFGGGLGVMYTADGAVQATTMHTVCWRLWHAPFDEETLPGDIWIDGQLLDTAEGYSPLEAVDEALSGASRLHAAGTGAQPGSNMWSSALYFWHRLLEPGEIRLLHADPLAPWRLNLLDLVAGEEKPVSLGDIRSRRYEPDPPPRKSRFTRSGKKPATPVPKIARTIKSGKREQVKREHQQRMMAAHVRAPSVTAGVETAAAVTRRYTQLRSTWHLQLTPVYRFFRSNVGPPHPNDSPFATSSFLNAFTPPDTFADGTWYLSVDFYNGVESSGFLPLGPNGETYLLLIVAGGVLKLEPPTPPGDVRLEVAAGGVVKVFAAYVQNSGARATQWALRYTTDGSEPAEGNPNVTAAIGSGSAELLEYALPPQAHGTTVKVRVQVRRDDSGTWTYSLGSSVVSAAADAQGPAAVADGQVFPGGVPK